MANVKFARVHFIDGTSLDFDANRNGDNLCKILTEMYSSPGMDYPKLYDAPISINDGATILFPMAIKYIEEVAPSNGN